jgi:hypothetical protein
MPRIISRKAHQTIYDAYSVQIHCIGADMVTENIQSDYKALFNLPDQVYMVCLKCILCPSKVSVFLIS